MCDPYLCALISKNVIDNASTRFISNVSNHKMYVNWSECDLHQIVIQCMDMYICALIVIEYQPVLTMNGDKNVYIYWKHQSR